jgi:hypothetical protein
MNAPVIQADDLGVPLLEQLMSNSATCCPIGYQEQLEAAIAAGDISDIADLAEELVQETCPRQLWALVAHLMCRCSPGKTSKEASHG